MKKIKKKLLLLLAMPITLLGQYNSENVLYNRMENLNLNVSSIDEKTYNSDKSGKQKQEPYESRYFTFNKNMQIEKVIWDGTDDSHLAYFFKFEETSPYFLKQVIIEGDFVHKNYNYSYTVKNSTNGSIVFKKFLKNGKPFREFTLDKNQNIIAVYEYDYNGEKSYTDYLYEYNNQGYPIKETRLYYDKPREITTYKLNEHGDIIEKLEFDVEMNNYKWKYEYVYTYDKNNNWVTKKEVMMGFKENGKLKNKSEFGYKFYTREIIY